MAAVAASGDGALLSHRTAAELWGLGAHGGDVEVTVPGGRAAPPRAGVLAHRCTDLAPSARTVVRGIPVTTLARTLFDLAGVVAPHEFRRALRRAQDVPGFDERLRCALSASGARDGAAASGGSSPGSAPR